jgi:hypothetical protein
MPRRSNDSSSVVRTASRCSTSRVAPRSVRSTSRSGRASSCRDPRRRRSRSSPSTRSARRPNLELVFADLATALPELDGRVAVVASNPPYVPLAEMPLDPEVRIYDPERALYGGVDGLDVVRVLSRRALALLRPGGALVIEHGERQSAAIAELLAADGWRAIAHHRDLTTRDRATTALR